MSLQRHTVVLLWRTLAIASLAVGVVGIVVPVLPTVPFVLVAAWAAGRGWPQLERWLLAHPVYGPMTRRWRERRAIPRNAKWFATISMAVSGSAVALFAGPPLLRFGVPATMALVAAWMWTRPDE